MSEKRFTYFKVPVGFAKQGIKDNVNDEVFDFTLDNVLDKLNEQQELIEELHTSDHMGWERAEKFEKELKQKKIYIKRLEYKVQKFKEENERLKNKLNVTALELVDEAISMGKAVEISEMNYHEFLEYRRKKGKPMELENE